MLIHPIMDNEGEEPPSTLPANKMDRDTGKSQNDDEENDMQPDRHSTWHQVKGNIFFGVGY